MTDKSTKDIPEEHIRAKAYEIWRERKGKESNPEGDWYAAKKILEEKKFWSFFTDSNNRDFALEVVKTVISALGLVATVFAGVGLLLTFWNAKEDRKLTREGLVTERFSKAVEQLGEEKDTTVRLGGIYALERIAKDSERDHWTIMEVLTSYIRENSPLSEQEEADPIDIDVQAALTVIGRRHITQAQRHLEKLEEGKNIDLTNTYLPGAKLAKAYLAKTNFADALLEEADLTKANLLLANLSRAKLSRAKLTGVNLAGTILKKADLFCTNLSKAENLTIEQIKTARNWKKAIYDEDFRRELGLPSASQDTSCQTN